MAKKQTVPKDSSLSRVLAQRTGGWLIASIDEWLESGNADNPPDPGWFHPSSLGSPCDAMLAFAYMGMPSKSAIRARSHKILDNGTSRHIDISRYLVKSGRSVFKHWEGPKAHKERAFEIPGFKIRGEIDDMVYNPLTKEKFVLEFKTMNTDEFQKLRKPKDDHVLQAHCYMFGWGVLQAIILYEDKNNQEWKSYVVKFDIATWNSIVSRTQNIIALVEEKSLPWRTPLSNDSQCKFYHMCAGFQFKEEAKT